MGGALSGGWSSIWWVELYLSGGQSSICLVGGALSGGWSSIWWVELYLVGGALSVRFTDLYLFGLRSSNYPDRRSCSYHVVIAQGQVELADF